MCDALHLDEHLRLLPMLIRVQIDADEPPSLDISIFCGSPKRLRLQRTLYDIGLRTRHFTEGREDIERHFPG